MKVRDFLKQACAVALAVAAAVAVTACDSSDSDDDDDVNSVVGRWAMVSQANGERTWWEFFADGTFAYYNDPGFSSKHLNGTYTQDGNKIRGPFTNPGVGTGELDCTLSADGHTLQMDFIEHWHTPYKHVPHIGTRI